MIYVESSHFLSHLIPELQELFDGKFVHLHRNGLDFVKSGLRRGWYRRPPFQEVIKAHIRRRLLLDIGYTFRDHKLTPPVRYRSRLAKTTWLWVEINNIILEAMTDLPADRKMVLPLESVSEDTMRSVFEFVEAPLDLQQMARIMTVVESRPNQTKPASGADNSEGWSSNDYETFIEIVSATMKKLNYATDVP